MKLLIFCFFASLVSIVHGQIAPDLARKAAAGDVEAQIELGAIYESGRGVSADREKAIIWYRKAAEKGSALAQFALGRQYQSEQGKPNPLAEEGLRWYRKAAEQGHVHAKFNLFTVYRYGLGVPANYSEAVKWLSTAAFNDHPMAQANLGYSYLDGIIMPKDPIDGLAWLMIVSSKHSMAITEFADFSQKLGQAAVIAAQARASELKKHIKRVELGNP